MRKTILALGALLPPEMDALERDYHVVRLWREADPEKTLQDERQNVVAILSTYNGMPVTRKIIESLPNLEIISQFGVGVDNIDIGAARERSIAVTSTPDILTADTADTAMALTLTLLRRVVEADMYVRVGKWENGTFPLATSLGQKKVGIIGLGRIGQAIARRMSAFDMSVVYHGPRRKDNVIYPFYNNLNAMAQDVDVLVVACPGGDSTEGMVNYDVLKALGSRGFLINIARGSVVNTQDLMVALRNGDIAGAGLDVYENEPHVPDALISMDNVVLLPHVGSATAETRAAMGQLVVANIMAHFNGDPLLTPVLTNPIAA